MGDGANMAREDEDQWWFDQLERALQRGDRAEVLRLLADRDLEVEE